MFENFPKKRKLLPEKYLRIFQEHYKANRNGSTCASSISQRFERWMHKIIARDVNNCTEDAPTLEIGAGTLNHLQYEPHIKTYDIIEPSSYLYVDSPQLDRIRKVYADIKYVPDTASYKRIVSIATFEHITNLPQVVAKAGLLLGENGQLRVSIPSEGELLWKWAQAISTGLEFRLKYKLDYNVLIQCEHINTAGQIEEVLSYFFNEVDCSLFGFSKKLSLYQFYGCSLPDLYKCRAYLEQVS
jgi:hypothetical protein